MPINILQLSSNPFRLLAIHLLLILFLVGCSGSGTTGLAVHGRVVLDDEPLPDGLITLMPQQNSLGLRTVEAKISDGKFLIPPSSKLQAGSYKVMITAEKPSGKRIPAEEGSRELADEYRQYLPAKYNAQTTLRTEITGEMADLEFRLKMK